MRSGRREYLVSCPISNQKEKVHIYYINDAPAFNGCDKHFHSCAECDECRVIAQKLFEQERDAGLLPHGHTRV